MKTKNIILIAFLVLLMGFVSCKKDHDIPTGKVFNSKLGGGDSITISVSANPSNGGNVIGGGKYPQGGTCIVTASANEGYVFTDWTENGTQVSTSVSYSFTADADRTLVANFSISAGNYTISAVASPLYGGIVNGSGTYEQGQTCTVTAAANEGYIFVNWTENGNQVSTDDSYSFTVTGNRTLVANFMLCNYSGIILNEINGNDKFIEIYNTGAKAVNMNGVYIEKDGNTSWIADNTVSIEAGGYLVLYSEDVVPDHPEVAETLILHCGLSAKKNVHIQLFTPTGVSIDDFNLINIEANDPAYIPAPASYSRNADGNWYYADATPGATNVEGTVPVLGLESGDTPEPSIFSISVSAVPSNGGMVSGGGSYSEGQSCTVTAVANEGYTFINWTENGNQISTDANYTFTVTGNRNLVANFTFTPNEPDYTNIMLNELNGDTKFIEIYNKCDMDLPLEGMYLMKDDYVAGAIWTADATVVAPAHGYVLLYSEDVQIDMPDYPEALIFHSGISSKKTIRMTLFMPDGTVRDEFTRGITGEWGMTVSNVTPQSYARTPNGGDWKLAEPTPGEANPATGKDIPQE